MPKAPDVLKNVIRFWIETVNFHIRYHSQMNFPRITGVSNIVTRPTNVHQPFKSLNSLAVSHTVAPSRDNTYRIRFQKHGPEHLIANGRYCNGLPRWVHLDQIQKQILKSTARLPQYIDVVHTVGQQFFPLDHLLSFNPHTRPKIGLTHHLT